ncbi:MAG: hypothetical protein LIP02_08960 [Bacteroidales bacterium]|nr:hypothetical protein [Bacteroidales bacterium]
MAIYVKPFPVSAFTLASYTLPVSQFPKSIRNRIKRKIPNSKRNSQYTALLLGQLSVFDQFSGRGLGDEALLFIKTWVSGKSNISGCRYLIVDAINNEKVINLYQRNGYKLIFETIEDETEYMRLDLEPEYKRARLMYFDLIPQAS